MERKWIFQANPQRYDIDSALRELSEIAWRAPQHAGEIQPGDVVAIWRSGPEAGVVAVGRIVSTPAAAAAGPGEDRFRVSRDEEGSEITRVTIRLRPCAFVPKERVAALASMRDHPIVTAPMGTVFPVSGEQWQELARELPEPPAGDEPGSPEPVPQPFAWRDRKKSAFPPPGGYGAYLESLERILRHIEAHRPERSDAIAWTQTEFDVSEWRSRMTLGFLQAVSLIREEAGRLELTQYAAHWLETGDASLLVGLLHSRVRFLGEMLEALREPRTAEELLDIANDSYGTGWTTRAQIDRRRGWLESAGAIEADDEGRLRLTERGREILEKLDLAPPVADSSASDAPAAPERAQPVEPRSAEPAEQPVRRARRPSSEEEEAEQVARRVEEASRNASDPDGFERAIADCFEFLGFDAKWLGGAGKTDVFLKAELGIGDRYAVVVDAKTTSHEAVRDAQIDWVTLEEHREKYNAAHVAIVAPAFQGERLAERAKRHGVAVLRAADLASLCRQHARVPLGLDAYRDLFRLGEESGVEVVAEHAEETKRWLELAAAVCRLVGDLEGQEGPLSARDLYWNLRGFGEGSDSVSDEEISAVLYALASAPIAILRRFDDRFASIGSRRTAARRLRRLADLIEAEPESEEGGG